MADDMTGPVPMAEWEGEPEEHPVLDAVLHYTEGYVTDALLVERLRELFQPDPEPTDALVEEVSAVLKIAEGGPDSFVSVHTDMLRAILTRLRSPGPSVAQDADQTEPDTDELVGRLTEYVKLNEDNPDMVEALVSDIEALTRLRSIPSATYEHPDYGLTCSIGGCSLEVACNDPDEGTCYYVATTPETRRSSMGEPDGERVEGWVTGVGWYRGSDGPRIWEIVEGEPPSIDPEAWQRATIYIVTPTDEPEEGEDA